MEAEATTKVASEEPQGQAGGLRRVEGDVGADHGGHGGRHVVLDGAGDHAEAARCAFAAERELERWLA